MNVQRLDVQLKPILKPLYRYCYTLCGNKDDAQDLTQESLMRALRNSAQFLQAEHKKSWIFKVALNLHRDQYRRKSRTPQHVALVGPLAEQTCADSDLSRRELVEEMMKRMNKLPSIQRQAIYLRCVENYSIGEIANLLNTTEGSIKTSLSIAREKLRRQLDENMVAEK